MGLMVIGTASVKTISGCAIFQLQAKPVSTMTSHLNFLSFSVIQFFCLYHKRDFNFPFIAIINMQKIKPPHSLRPLPPPAHQPFLFAPQTLQTVLPLLDRNMSRMHAEGGR